MGDLLQVPGRPDPLRGMKFQVAIPDLVPLQNMGFSKISGASQEAEMIEYREGDEPLAQRKIPGLIKTGEVTLERGISHVTSMEALNAWKVQASTALAGQIDGSVNFRHDVYVQVLNRLGLIEWEVRLINAWPRMIEYGDLDANSSDIWIATFTLVYETLTTGHTAQVVAALFPSPVVISLGG
jgi:phage tail-like protein